MFVPTPERKKKKQSGKVVRVSDDMYSVHTNQVYRTVCHVPLGNKCFSLKRLIQILFLGMPASCSFKTCISSKQLCLRNNVQFECSHTKEVSAADVLEPELPLQTRICR